MLLQVENSSSSSLLHHRNHDNSCLSKLTREFVKKAEYAQITKDEALYACKLVLLQNTTTTSSEEYLFHSLIENGILVPSSKNIYLLHDISTQAILVKLSTCYSPSCSLDRVCYSPTCPNKQISTLLQLNHANTTDNSKIPRFILEGLSKKEKKRQLALEELEQLEDNFIKQLVVIRDKFAKPLLFSNVIEESRKITFHNTLFGNYNVLANYHSKILKELQSLRKREYNLYDNSILVGEILYKYFKKLMDPYIIYTSNRVFSEYLLNLELSRNVSFYQFIEHQQSLEKDFRLTLKGLLLSPVVRITKYQLLFETIIQNSPLDEQYSLQQSKELVLLISDKMNEATRKAQTEQRLIEIKHGIKFKKNRSLSQILPDDISLVYEGKLELMNRIPPITCQVFLFSNSLFITREKLNTLDNSSEFTLIDKPIPLHMLQLTTHTNTSISSTSSQPTLLSSIRHQLSNGSYHYYQRRWNSENNISSTRIVSDDGSSTYSGVYSLSGLKLRHRIKSIKKKMKKTKTISYTPTNTSITSSSPAPRVLKRRILQFNHLADPTLTYLFECTSADERLVWKNKIKSVLPNPDDGPFALDTLVSNSNYSSLRNVNGRYATGCGTIWCSLPFTCSDGRDVIALGTRLGVWVAYTDGSEIFRHILPYNCHQLELFDNRILLARCSKPNRILGAILIDHIYPPSNETSTVDIMKEFQPLQKSGVISFAVGTLRGESIICYLRRRRTGSVRLVLMSYQRSLEEEEGGETIPFRKYKEYKPMTLQPKDLIIIQDTVYIRSPTEGIEKVDIINWIMGTQNNTFHHVKYSYKISLSNYYPMMSSITNNTQTDDPSLTTIAYVPLNQKETGLICSGKAAYPVVEPNTDLLQQEILFETEAKNVVISYPYLIVFSFNVIEIRHLETTALVQAIGGNKIKCVYVSRPTIHTSPPIIHITMLHADEDQTKVYQLYLKEPIAADE